MKTDVSAGFGLHLRVSIHVNKISKLSFNSSTGRELEETSRYLFQRLGLLLMRRNAALILNRTPFHVDAVVGGDLDYDVQGWSLQQNGL